MSHNDERHEHCQHEMKVCEPCDAAYCVNCKREWRNTHYQPIWTQPTVYGMCVRCGGSMTANHRCWDISRTITSDSTTLLEHLSAGGHG